MPGFEAMYRAMAKSLDDRFQTVQELECALVHLEQEGTLELSLGTHPPAVQAARAPFDDNGPLGTTSLHLGRRSAHAL